jgi:GDPmannose 4,6-dehydratase
MPALVEVAAGQLPMADSLSAKGKTINRFSEGSETSAHFKDGRIARWTTMKKAMITGITGQDGAYLSRLLLEKGYEVYGAFRRTSDLHLNRLKYLGVDRAIHYLPLELLEFTNIYKAIERVQADEFYNLGAQSFVALSFDEPIYTTDVTAMGPLRVLEAIRVLNPQTKFYQASSSEMFGKVQTIPQDETTPFYPRSPYSIAKLAAHWATVNYRESYGLFACSGILFNHESPLRGLEFVTRKITHGIAEIQHGLQEKLTLGNLNARRDWGFAPEYVEAMWRMMQQSQAEDYVVATGETHTIREFAEHAFQAVGIDIRWEGKDSQEKGFDKKTGKIFVEVSPEFFRPAEVDLLIGNAKKAETKLGWKPRTKFQDLVHLMVEADLKRVSDSRY